ncbi:MAG: 2-dehydropantoate 2-reductase [Candidatus Omnitrophica bacterium]|nr:2-dehydropantoate 2-reductase [Candidatus Omnitrophota bacterium]
MKVVIVGPGAIGTLLAAHLGRSKNEIWILDKKAERADRLRQAGLRLQGLSKFEAKVNASCSAKEIGRADIIIICVKAYDTEGAVDQATDLIKEDTYVLSLQNGLGNLQILNDLIGEEKVIAGVTHQAATLLNIGVIRHTGKGETIIGRINKQPLGKARVLLELLNQARIPTRSSRDINSLIWSKLLINAGINALSAITRLPNGMLLKHPETRELMRSVVSEGVRVAKRKRIKLSYDDPIQKVESVCRETSSNLSSMLQDVLNKKQTEIDFINGAILRQAKSLNIATPVNEVLTNLVKTIEKSYS